MTMPASHITVAPTLAELLDGIASAPPLPVAGIDTDSRRLRAGDVFLATRGATAHALDYLAAADARTLAAIVWDGDAQAALPDGVTAIAVPGLARHIGDIANRFFDWPSHAVTVDAVTGTNGKTTVAWLLAQCWQRLDRSCAYIGTLGAGIGDVTDSGGLTTPDCVQLHRLLAGFRDAGADRAALEASSHALAQGRLDGVRIGSALFTNLSRDHMDFHGDMRAYFETKARLFSDFGAQSTIVCVDNPYGAELAERLGRGAVTVATSLPAAARGERFVAVRDARPHAAGTRVAFDSAWGAGDVQLPLFGGFNVANAMLAAATLLASDVSFDEVCGLLEVLQAPPGRLQRVPGSEQAAVPTVFVDYAHTPAALEAVLDALRAHSNARLWCVFGCGGDRDRGKRPEMGRAVASRADVAVVTSDNPRTEDPAAILRDVQQGMPASSVAIEDRAAAISWAIDHADAGDIVLIAGKGHEDYQVLGTQRVPFSDVRIAAEILARRRAGA